jgi:hypothetical protein
VSVGMPPKLDLPAHGHDANRLPTPSSATASSIRRRQRPRRT